MQKESRNYKKLLKSVVWGIAIASAPILLEIFQMMLADDSMTFPWRGFLLSLAIVLMRAIKDYQSHPPATGAPPE